eukprot:SAG11_NODE_5393_length_1573_cov_7.108548_1_plen_68_part_00
MDDCKNGGAYFRERMGREIVWKQIPGGGDAERKATNLLLAGGKKDLRGRLLLNASEPTARDLVSIPH